MAVEIEFNELKRVIAPLYDETRAPELTNIEVTQIRGELTYILGSVSSKGLQEKLTASDERQVEIDSILDEAERLAAAASDVIDEMLADPARIRLPASMMGARSRVRQTDQGEDVAPALRRAELTLALPREPIPDSVATQTTPEMFVQSDVPDVMGASRDCGDAPQLNDDVLQNIVGQLRNEFERLYRQAQPVCNTAASVAPSDIDEFVAASRQPKGQANPNGAAANTKPAFELKMDRFSLPSFSGSLTEWISFRDQYIDLVHENPRCTPILKFLHLRSCLSGRAAEVINGFQLSETDYEAAWEALCHRFDNKGQLIAEYIKRVLHLPCLDRNPTKEKLLNMVDRANQMLRVLPHFGINVKQWDPMILVVLLEKIDPTTEAKWLDQIKRRERVQLREFLEFLENQASEAAVIQGNKAARPQPPKPQKPQQKKAVLLTNAEPGPSKPVEHEKVQDDMKGAIPISRTKCPHPKCSEYHPPYRCQKFLSLPRAKREELIRAAGLCVWCLNLHKSGKKCTFGNCKICKGDHNNLLCVQKEAQDAAANQLRAEQN